MNRLLVILLFFHAGLKAQEYQLRINPLDSLTSVYTQTFKYDSLFTDSVSILKTVNNIHNQLIKDGYYSYSANGFWKNNEYNYLLTIGNTYGSIYVNLSAINPLVLADLGLQVKLDIVELNVKESEALIESILRYYEDNGYPFARIQMRNIEVNSDSIKGSLTVNEGPYRKLDSLVIKGNTSIPKGFVNYYLGLKTNKEYSEKKLRNIDSDLQRVNFLQSVKPVQVLFEKERTTGFLYIDKQNANQISGIAGLNTLDDGTIFFTGELDLRLYHTFKAAESIEINWSAPRAGSQQLNADIDFPYLFNSPFGIVSNFYLYREDTIFSNRNYDLGVSFKPNSKTGLEFAFQNRSSSNLQEGENLGSFNTDYFLIKANWNSLNHSFLPTKGIYAKITAGQGTRSSEGSNTTQYQGELSSKFFIPTRKNHHFYTTLEAGGLFNTDLVLNEVYRLGGVNSIRGFNEQSLFASSYIFTQLEYRYFLERFTYAFIFSDLGYIDNDAATIPFSSSLIGLGAGFSFYTNGGIFSLAFAVGKQDDASFDIRNIKVHIGYVNQF